jgi:hypothetical protein
MAAPPRRSGKGPGISLTQLEPTRANIALLCNRRHCDVFRFWPADHLFCLRCLTNRKRRLETEENASKRKATPKELACGISFSPKSFSLSAAHGLEPGQPFVANRLLASLFSYLPVASVVIT